MTCNCALYEVDLLVVTKCTTMVAATCEADAIERARDLWPCEPDLFETLSCEENWSVTEVQQ